MVQLSVVVPAYNEESRIYANLERLKETLKTLDLSHEIVVVNDGSKDNTLKEIWRFVKKDKNVKVVTYSENKGKGSAIKEGFLMTNGDLITFIDADGDLPSEQIKTFLDYMNKYRADVVVGSKRHPESNVNYSAKRKFLSWGYYIMNRMLFNLPVKDTQAGLKLYKRKVLEEVLPKTLIKRFAFDLEILANANKKGYKIIEAPITINHSVKFDGIGFRTIYSIFMDTMAVAYRMYIKKHYDKK